MGAGEREGLSRGAILTVYPTALKARAAVRAAVEAVGAVLGSRATTFPELTDTLARELGVTGRILPPELAALVLQAAVADLPDLSTDLGRRGGGLLRELQAAIDELKAAHVTPAALREAAHALPAEAAGRVFELGRIHRAYEERLARLGALDRHGREWAVADGLAECVRRGVRPPVLTGVRRIVFAEIYDVSVLQYLIVTALIRLVGDAELVAFAHPENVDGTRFLDRTWSRFVASESIATEVLPSFVVREGRQGSLAAALRGVFAVPPVEPAAGDGSIRLLVAPHRYGEVEAVLREVRRRLEAGADPERLALVARDMGGRYAELIDDVARRFGVPVYFRRGVPLLASGAVREAIGLLRCALEDLPRARVAAVLDGDYFGIRRPRAAALLGSVGYVTQAVCALEDCLARHAAAEGESAGRAARARRGVDRHRPVLRRVVRAVAQLRGRRPIAEHVRRWRHALGTLRFRPVAREDVAPTAAARDARAWQRFDDLLDAIAAVSEALGGPPVELEEFLGLVVATAQLEETTEAPVSGGVRALSVLDARGLDFDVVYLLGLDDGTFPAAHRESAVLPDALKRLLGPALAAGVRRDLAAHAVEAPAGPLLRTAREASLEDPFLFFLALSMPERELVLSHPAADERGNPTVRSPFVDEVEACLAEPLPERRVDPLALVPVPPDCCAVDELVARAAADRWQPAPSGADGLTPALRRRLPGGAARLAGIDRRARVETARSRYFLTPLDSALRAAAADPFVGRVPASADLARRLDALRWSPKGIDDLAACGFKFYAARLLGAKDRDEAGPDVEPRDRGTLLHRVLEVVLRECPVLPDDVAAARAVARAAASRARPAILAAVPPKDRAVVDVEWERMLAALDVVVAAEVEEQREAVAAGCTVERLLEWSFAMTVPGEGAGPPLVLGGRADRVDVWREGGRPRRLRVLDYKSKRSVTELNRALKSPAPGTPRTVYQIPLYLLGALHAGLAGDETELAGGYCAPFAPPADRRRVHVMARDALAAAAGEVRALVEGARGGAFDVAPRVCDPWCAYRTVCRYQAPPVEDEVG